MKLSDLLQHGKPVEVIMERANYPEWIDDLDQESIDNGMLVGYCTWTGEKLESLDGDSYSINAEVIRYEWREDGNLLIYWTTCEWEPNKKQ